MLRLLALALALGCGAAPHAPGPLPVPELVLAPDEALAGPVGEAALAWAEALGGAFSFSESGIPVVLVDRPRCGWSGCTEYRGRVPVVVEVAKDSPNRTKTAAHELGHVYQVLLGTPGVEGTSGVMGPTSSRWSGAIDAPSIGVVLGW